MAIAQGILLLEEGGLAQFSARRLAAQIGYTVGTLYNVFADYDDMILHINQYTLEELRMHLEKSIRRARTPERVIKNLALAYADFAKRHYFRWIALFEHRMAEAKPVPDWYGTKLKELFVLIEEPLRNHAGLGAKEAAMEARALWAGVHGICALGMGGKLEVVGNAARLEAMVELLLARYLSGMALSATA